MIYIAVLLTVHNRKEKTLQCLSNLFGQDLPDNYKIEVYLTDDGCTDGTSGSVSEKFPDVHIIKGDGNLFWNRGMFKAWETASSQRAYDYYLWLNDDSFLKRNCLYQLLVSSVETGDSSILVASMSNKQESSMTYGGILLETGKLATPNGQLQECSTMNGNCVLIPNHVFQTCGNLDWSYQHAIGDLDYGYIARRKGFKIFASKEYLGICEKGDNSKSWASPDVPFLQRLKKLYSPLGYAQPGPFFHFNKKHFGLYRAIKYYLLTHIRVCFPELWNRK